MRGLFGLKFLLVSNLVWTSVVFFMWGRSSLNSNHNIDQYDSKENHQTDLHNSQLVMSTMKRMLRSKYPDDEDLLSSYFDNKLPTIYAVTPTYTRWTQKAELTRLCQSFLHVPNFFWIIVEDSSSPTDLVANFLKTCGIPYAHLYARTEDNFKMKSSDPSWLMPRGVSQRNEGLKWILENVNPEDESILYFVDDDNTYSLRIFEEMRFTKTVSVWPVGIVGGLKFEGPLCENGKVTSWYTAWKPDRPFPIDMAGFAVNLDLIFKTTDVFFSNTVQRGYQESHFLSKFISKDQLEAKGNNCDEILVWHTRTEKPNMKQELKLQKIGKASNPKMEV